MTIASTTKSSEIRSRIGHPVVDADGHIQEYLPLVEDYIREEAGRRQSKRLEQGGVLTLSYGSPNDPAYGKPGSPDWYQASAQERHDWRLPRPGYWGEPTKLTLDAATSRLPRLLESRLGELGLDFAVLYPTAGLRYGMLTDDELRQISCRAFNRYLWDTYGPHSEVMTPAALIPASTPEEAIEELEFAVGALGFKAVLLPAQIRRPVRAVAGLAPELASHATYIDKLALDSEHDYDPLWRKLVELKVSPTFHSGSQNWDSRNSPSSYMYNHIGHFAASSEALAKALFFGGVTTRFPELAFGFLEAGVGWAVNLYADLIGHWEKRNGQAIYNYDPGIFDEEELIALVQQYGNDRLVAKVKEVEGRGFVAPNHEDPSVLDEFRHAGLERAEQIKDRFVPNFFFGCEADDPINALAFNTKVNPFGARLNAVFSTDIGHWDVPDMRGVVEEAYELVEHQLITEDDFRDFVFTNPVKLHTRLNKDFFKGTAIEDQAAQIVSGPRIQA